MIRRPIYLAVAAFLSLIPFLARPAIAAWPLGGLAIDSGPFVTDNAGGFWVGSRTAQHIDGTPTILAGGVPCLPSGNFAASDAAPDGSGGVVLALVASGDIFAGRVISIGSVMWGSSGVIVCNAATNQSGVQICGDGSGGAILAWQDPRSGLDDIYVQRIAADGSPMWTTNGINICPQAGKQRDLSIISDGAGGAIVAWGDPRAGEPDQNIYAQRVNPAGVPQWSADGIAVTAAPGVQAVPVLVPDGAGGAIVTWWDLRSGGRDVYAQHLSSLGVAQWAADGIPIANGSADEYQTGITSDGAGGAFLVWEDYRNSNQSDIFAQHVSGAGSLLWAAGGVAVCTESHTQSIPRVVIDGAGGMIAAWTDGRTGGSPQEIRVQRLNNAGVVQWQMDGVSTALSLGISQTVDDRVVPDGAGGIFVGGTTNAGSFPPKAGVLRVYSDGSPGWNLTYRANWTGVIDDPGDQGGWVQLRFNRATGETGFTPPVTAYSIWRRVQDTAFEPEATVERARDIVAKALTGPARLSSRLATAADFPPGSWETFGSIPAMFTPSYVFAAPTHDDSTLAGPADDQFLIVSHTSNTSFSVSSPVAVGHSVDNLPPLTPQNAAGSSSSPGTAQLQWSPNGERDLIGYAVYKGNSPGFVPSVGNRLGTPTSPMWTDNAFDGASYYKVSALDRHGNQSGYALITPNQVTGVGPADIPAVSFVRPPQPNPARAHVSFDYGLARNGHVRMDILDVHGRLVRTVLDRIDLAGSRSITWEGVDEAGRDAAPGIYWVHFVAPETERTVRLVWLR